MISGGGRLSKLPETFHVRSSSLKSSISSVSSWNYCTVLANQHGYTKDLASRTHLLTLRVPLAPRVALTGIRESRTITATLTKKFCSMSVAACHYPHRD